MAKVIDVRGSGGQLILLGEVLALPQSSNPLPPNNISYMAGSIRFNPQTDAVEFLSSEKSWRDITNNNIERVTTVTVANYVINGDGSYYRISSLTDAVLTVPHSTSINFPLGTTFRIMRTTASAVRLEGESTVKINTPSGLSIEHRWGTIWLTKVSLNEWDVDGDLA